MKLLPLRAYHWAYDGILPERPTAMLLLDLLVRLVELCGMTAIADPVVSVRRSEYAAFQLIAESHISIHGKGERCWADVFSCKPFQEDAVGKVLRDTLRGEWTYRQMRAEEEET
jgi:S-adenosylmethionine/arginine decarboxylase-like enzyme